MHKRLWSHKLHVLAAVLAAVLSIALLTPVLAQAAGTPNNIAIYDMPTQDTVAISAMRVLQTVDGTPPFDANNQAGNDSNDHNGIVRSFDALTYDIQYSTQSDNPYEYFRQAYVGFTFTLDAPSSVAQFNTGQMAWMEQTGQYRFVTTERDGAQTLTCYRKLVPTDTTPTTIPGTATVRLSINVLAAGNHTILHPKVRAWVEPNAGNHQPYELALPAEQVSAAMSLNLKVRNTQWPIAEYNQFANTDSSAPFANIGTVFGWKHAMAVGTEMRWPDRSKGVKGLEVPSGPISFNIHVQVSYRDAEGAHTTHPAIQELQPYLYDWNDLFGGRNTTPNAWTVSGVPFFTADQTSSANKSANGTISISNVKRDASGLHARVTFDHYDVVHWPNRDATDSGQCLSWATATTMKTCNLEDYQVANIHADWASLVTPVYIDGKTVAEYYGANQTAQVHMWADGLQATSITGQKLPEATDTSNQAVTDDDDARDAFNATIGSGYDTHILYSSPTVTTYNNNPKRGDWLSHNAKHGSDVLLPGEKVGVSVGYTFKSSSTAQLPSASRVIMKFDANEITPDLTTIDPTRLYHRNAGDYGVNSRYLYTWGSSVLRFAVRHDGRNWASFEQMSQSNPSDLDIYDTYEQAAQHGTVVAVVWDATMTLNQTEVSYGKTYQPGTGIPMTVLPTARVGSISPVVIHATTWTRGDLAADSELNPTDPDERWIQYASHADLARISDIKATWDLNAGKDYLPAQFDAHGQYAGGDSAGYDKGDTAIIGSEIPRVKIQVAQRTAGQAKSIFDLDRAERTVDWQITPSVDVPAGTPDDYTTGFTITDDLPAGLTYQPGSAYLSGTYTEHTPKPGTVSDGVNIAPTSIVHKDDGGTTITWTVPPVAISHLQDAVLHYSTSIGTEDNPDTDTKNGQQYLHAVAVTSTHFFGHDTLAQHHQTSMMVSKLTATSITTRADELIYDANQPIAFTSTLGNFANTKKDQPLAIDILPYNAGYHGSYYLTGLTISSLIGQDMTGVMVYATDNQNVRTYKPTDYHVETIRSTWQQLPITNGTVTLPKHYTPVAYAIIGTSLSPNGKYTVHTQLTPTGNRGGDLYEHTWLDGSSYTQAATQIADRTVSGTLWQDSNANGARDTGEPAIPGARVQLVQAGTNTPVSTTNGKLAQVTTDEHGYYEISNVPAGRFELRITPPAGALWQVTTQHADGVDSQHDSDGEQAPGGARIILQEYKTAQQQGMIHFVDSYEDVGFIQQHTTLPVTGSTAILVVLIGVGVLLAIGVYCARRPDECRPPAHCARDK